MSQGAILSVQARRGLAGALAAERSRELTRRAIPDPRAASRSRLKLGSFPGVIGAASPAQANSARTATMAIASQSRKTPLAVRARAIGAPPRRPHARRWPRSYASCRTRGKRLWRDDWSNILEATVL